MAITEDDALAMLNASIAKANELGVKVAISIVDELGQLVATVRMAGVGFQWLAEAAQGKAMATVLWRGQPSGELTERAGYPLFQWVRDNYATKPLYQKGAVPIRRDGALIGAIGGAGASPDQDEEVAVAGAGAIGS